MEDSAYQLLALIPIGPRSNGALCGCRGDCETRLISTASRRLAPVPEACVAAMCCLEIVCVFVCVYLYHCLQSLNGKRRTWIYLLLLLHFFSSLPVSFSSVSSSLLFHPPTFSLPPSPSVCCFLLNQASFTSQGFITRTRISVKSNTNIRGPQRMKANDLKLTNDFSCNAASRSTRVKISCTNH